MIRQEDYHDIRIDRRGRVLTLTLDRPEALNATDARLHAELARVFRDADADEGSDVIVLTGEGRAFCAGGDINWMQDMIDDPERWNLTATEAKQIIFSLLECEKPVLAKVNGPAVGLGATIALFCDIIFAADDTFISDPHVSIGMVAGDGGSVIWPQLIGYARAKEFLLTGNKVPSRRAAEIGLINHAVPRLELDARVDAFADELVAGATKAIRWSKVTLNIGLRQLAHSMMDTGLAYEGLTNISADHRERVRSFRERNPS